LLLVLFIISQWVYQMIIQAHLGWIIDHFLNCDLRDIRNLGPLSVLMPQDPRRPHFCHTHLTNPSPSITHQLPFCTTIVATTHTLTLLLAAFTMKSWAVGTGRCGRPQIKMRSPISLIFV
jgi:hypothetical protein